MTTKTRRRVKLVTTFVAMIVTLCMTCFGIMAAVSVRYTMSGGIQFNVADKVAATISGTYAVKDGEASAFLFGKDGMAAADYTTQAVFKATDEDAGQYGGAILMNTDGNNNLVSTSLDDYFTFKFVVTNDLTTDSLNVALTTTITNYGHLNFQNVDDENAINGFSYKLYGGESGKTVDTATATNVDLSGQLKDTAVVVSVPKGQTVEFTIRLALVESIENHENAFTASYGFALQIQRPGN